MSRRRGRLNFVRDGPIRDGEAGDAAEARVMLIDQTRERAFVTPAERSDHARVV